MLLLFIGTRVAPVVATIVVIATLVTCVSIAKANKRYLGGLAWPYLSDTGRDTPGYAVFCAGLSTVGVSLVLTWSGNYQYQSELLQMETDDPITSTIQKCCKAVRAFGVLSAFGLPILAFFSTTSYPDVHQYAAYWFFVFEAVALVLNVRSHLGTNPVAEAKAVRLSLDHRELQAFASQSVQCVKVKHETHILHSIDLNDAVLGRVPALHLALVADFQRLTIKDCLALNLGEKYCTDTMQLNDTETKLWNYDNDHAINQMRSASQLACILTLVGYSLSFLSHTTKSLQENTV